MGVLTQPIDFMDAYVPPAGGLIQLVQAVSERIFTTTTGDTVVFAATPANDETILLVLCNNDAITGGITAPTGFTQIHTSGTGPTITVWAKQASFETGASYSLSWSSQFVRATMYGLRLTGVDLSFIEASGSSTGFSATQTAPTVTTRTDYGWHLCVWHLFDGSGGGAEPAPTGYTKISTANDEEQMMAYKEIAAAGATGAQSVTMGNQGWTAVSLALRPDLGRVTKASDTFNRANGGLGSNWTTFGGALSISTNAVVNSNGDSADGGGYWSADTFGDDQWAEADVTLGAAYDEAAIMVRMSTASGNDAYAGVWDTNNSGRYRIARIDNGAWTTIGTAVTGVGATGTRKLRLEVVGTALTLYVNGVEQVAATDATYTSGRPGIWDWHTGDTATLDNFRAGDWVPRSAPIVSVSDDFNRTDGGLGTNWTTVTGMSALTISGNKIQPSVTLTDTGMWHNKSALGPDCFVQADITVNTSNTTNSVWLLLRGSGGDDGYFAAYPRYGGNNAEIGVVVDGVTTTLASVAIGTWTGTRTVKFEAIGPLLVMTVDGDEILSCSDTTYTTAGQAGVLLYHEAAGRVSADNFSAGATSLTESFTGTNGTTWDAGRWPIYNESNAGGAGTIETNRGRLLVPNVSGFQWTYYYSSVDTDDFEMTGTVQASATAENFWGVFFRSGNTSTASRSCYMLEAESATGLVSLIDADSGGIQTYLDSVTVPAVNGTGLLRFKLRAEGTQLRAKVWADGSTEPIHWTVSAEDSTWTAGRIGLYAINGNTPSSSIYSDWDDIQIIAPPPIGFSATKKFAGDLGSTATSSDRTAQTANCGTVQTGSLLVVTQFGVINDENWAVPTKSSGTATIGTFVQIAEGGTVGWTGQVTSWSAPVTSGGTLVLSTDEGTDGPSYGWYLIVDEIVGHDTTTPIVGAISQSNNSSGDPASATLGATPATGDLLINCYAWDVDTGGKTIDPGTGWTELRASEVSGNYTFGSYNARTGTTSTTVDWGGIRNYSGTVYNSGGVAFIVKKAT